MLLADCCCCCEMLVLSYFPPFPRVPKRRIHAITLAIGGRPKARVPGPQFETRRLPKHPKLPAVRLSDEKERVLIVSKHNIKQQLSKYRGKQSLLLQAALHCLACSRIVIPTLSAEKVSDSCNTSYLGFTPHDPLPRRLVKEQLRSSVALWCLIRVYL